MTKLSKKNAAANYLFCLMGPTAVGKTDIACHLVQRFPLEIISVDSAMIYRGMDIGTAKPSRETLAKAPHHLLDILNPSESYSAALFCQDVKKRCEIIWRDGKYPLLVGGTMMYFRALQQGLSALPQANEIVREKLVQQAQECGWDSMHQSLASIDPVAAKRIHPHDTQRIQRALEVYQLSKKPLTALLHNEQAQSHYHFVNLLVMPQSRQWLHQRIAQRFEQMLKTGFIEEVETITQQWQLSLANPALRCVGYRQIYAYLQGEDDYSTMHAKGLAATRQLAKRQFTWLRHWPAGTVQLAECATLTQDIMTMIEKKLANIV